MTHVSGFALSRPGRLVTGLGERQQARHAGALTASDALGEDRGSDAGMHRRSPPRLGSAHRLARIVRVAPAREPDYIMGE